MSYVSFPVTCIFDRCTFGSFGCVECMSHVAVNCRVHNHTVYVSCMCVYCVVGYPITPNRLRLCDELHRMQTGSPDGQELAQPLSASGSGPGSNVGGHSPDDMSAVAPMSTRIQVLRKSCADMVGVRKFDAIYDYLLTVPDHVSEDVVRDQVAHIVGDEELALQVIAQAQVIVAYETFANG